MNGKKQKLLITSQPNWLPCMTFDLTSIHTAAWKTSDQFTPPKDLRNIQHFYNAFIN